MLTKRFMRSVILITCACFFFSCKDGSKKEKVVSDTGDSTAMQTGDTIKQNTVSGNLDSVAMPVVPEAKLIVPGKSIGLTAIGEPADSVAMKLGKPDEGDAAMGKAISTWYSKGDKTHSTTIYFTTNFGDKDEASRARQVRITSPYFQTKDGLAVGSPMEDISKIFPVLKKTGRYPSPKDPRQMIVVMDDPTNGIAFEIDPSYTCVGLVVHLPGERPFETYLNFLKGYEPEED